MNNRLIHQAITQAILAVTLSITLHAPTYAATLTQTGAPGTDGTNATTDAGNGANATPGQDLTLPLTSSDPSNTLTITGGTGGHGGNGAPTTSAPQAGNAGAGANGGNATITATLSPTSNSTSTLTATGGNGGQAGLPGPAGTSSTAGNASTSGNGGNATITLAPLSTSPQLFTANITAQGGNGGDAQGTGALSGNGGTASISNLFLSNPSLFPANTDVNLTLNQIGGDAGIATNGATLGNGAASNLTISNTTAFSKSTGNITYSQNAIAGNGTLAGLARGGNTISTFSVSTFSGQSFNANVSAISRTGLSQATVFLFGGPNLIGSAYAAGPIATADAQLTDNASGPAKAIATSVAIPDGGLSFAGNAFAAANNLTTKFLNVALTAKGQSNGTQTALVQINAGPISFANGTPQAAVSAILTPLTLTTSGPINNSLANLQLLDSNASTSDLQTHTALFQGTLLPSKITPAELSLSLSTLSLPSNFNSLTFNFTIQGLTTLTINQSFTNYADAAAYFNQTIDLGPLASFGTAQFNINANLTLTTDTPGENFELAANLSNTDPSLVPEPTTLSLLVAALPLLLKRRCRHSPPSTLHSIIRI